MDHIPGEIIPIIAIGGGMLVAIVAIVCGTIMNIYRIHRQTSLKQMMLESGFPPHEIERVMNCGQDDKFCKSSSAKSMVAPSAHHFS